jgi:hypothetical protein
MGKFERIVFSDATAAIFAVYYRLQYFFIKFQQQKITKKQKKWGGAGPTKNTNPKAQAPTAQKAGTGLTASQCSSGGQPENPRPPTCAAHSARC